MPIPKIAIVGRPNVGKSSLLNMLAGAKVAIVDPTPGVTRDRLTSVVELESARDAEPPRLAEIIDTGGYGVYTAQDGRFNEVGEDLGVLRHDIEAQIAEAVRVADVILFVIDAQAGVTALDEDVASLLRTRRRQDPADGRTQTLMVIANKVDGEKWEPHALEAANLGFGEPQIVSAMTNRYRRQLIEALHDALPAPCEDEPTTETPEMSIAIVGKRNAGKSTLVNALAGEGRVIVSEIAGVTRDAIDVRFERDGRSFLAIDTAGFRKKRSLHDQIEWYAMHRALRSIRRADVALLLLDATAKVSGVDKRLGREIADQHKPCIIVVNKWDLAEGRTNPKGRPISIEDYRTYIEKELRGLSRAPIAFISAETGEGVDDVIELAQELHEQALERISTGKLNSIVKQILAERGPSSRLGTQAKILYATQVSSNPPTIVLVVNHAELFTPGYERYLLNRLAERTPFAEVPIRLLIRDRQRARGDDLRAGDGAHRAETPARPKLRFIARGLQEDDAEAPAHSSAEERRVARELGVDRAE